MKQVRLYSLMLMLMQILCSCGQLFEANDEEELLTGTISLDRKSFDIMVGDSCLLDVSQLPVESHDKAIAWMSVDENVVRFRGDTVIAVGEGQTDVTVTWLSQHVSATCEVTVYPHWQIDPYVYPHDALVYAAVTVGGRPADDQTIVGVFSRSRSEGGFEDYTLHGVGELHSEHGITYMLLRVYGRREADATYTLRCYDRKRLRVVEAASELLIPATGLGTLSNLYPIDFE